MLIIYINNILLFKFLVLYVVINIKQFLIDFYHLLFIGISIIYVYHIRIKFYTNKLKAKLINLINYSLINCII